MIKNNLPNKSGNTESLFTNGRFGAANILGRGRS